MNLIGLQLDAKAREMVSESFYDLNENDGWLNVTVRVAAQIDTILREKQYVGTVIWFSESDFIEKEIDYSGLADSIA
ncbi:MAG TPA: hypothetical protein DCS35_15085 [Vibrio sp.]|nr:hypothetical protein [Vibrio sp.]